MVGWHHQFDGHEFEQALVVGDGQGSLVWCAAVHGVAKIQTRLKRLSSSSSRHHVTKKRHYFVNKGPSSQGYGFSSSHVWI